MWFKNVNLYEKVIIHKYNISLNSIYMPNGMNGVMIMLLLLIQDENKSEAYGV